MTVPILLLLLSLVGLADTLYLAWSHLNDAGACGAGSGCGDVLGSPHAVWFGVPLPVFGLGLYAAFTILSWRAIQRTVRADTVRWISLLALPAVAIGLYLTYLQASVIGSWCPFCLLSFGLTVTILALSLRFRQRSSTLLPFVGSLASRHLVPPVAALVCPPILSLLLPSHGSAIKRTPDPIVARIGERTITASEIDHANRLDLYETRNRLRQEWLDRQLLETAAAEKGVHVRNYVQEEVYRGIDITQEEIDRRYAEIKSRLPAHVTKASVTRNIRNEIGSRKSKAALEAHVRELARRYGTTYAVPAEERFALDPNPRQGPEKGPESAPVTIVEFSDLECRYCARAHEHLAELMDRYEGRVRLIFRHLPLDMHRHARYAAEVASCANRQDRFWSLADTLFAHQDRFSEETILQHAVDAGLDPEMLKKCLDSGEGAGLVEADIAEADELGISSTPTFFVNGHYVGSLPNDGLAPIIERELARTQSVNPLDSP